MTRLRPLALFRALFVPSILFVLVPPVLAAGAPPALALSFTGNSVRVGNVTPGGEVVLFSAAKRGGPVAAKEETVPRLLSDSDGDGVVTLDGNVPISSVWIAVDWQSGAVATGAPGEFPIYVREIAPELYRKDAEDQIAALEKRITRMTLLLVRPGLGAWVLRGREGAEGDRDGAANGRLQLAFEDAAAIAGRKETPPKHLKAGDVVTIVDLGNLDIFLGQVTR